MAWDLIKTKNKLLPSGNNLLAILKSGILFAILKNNWKLKWHEDWSDQKINYYTK